MSKSFITAMCDLAIEADRDKTMPKDAVAKHVAGIIAAAHAEFSRIENAAYDRAAALSDQFSPGTITIGSAGTVSWQPSGKTIAEAIRALKTPAA